MSTRHITKAERRRQRKQRKAHLYADQGEEAQEIPFVKLFKGGLGVRQTAHKGQGLFALQAIPADTYVMDYEGEMISEAERQSRWLVAEFTSVPLSMSVCPCLSVCVSLCPSVCLSAFLPACLPVYMCVCLEPLLEGSCVRAGCINHEKACSTDQAQPASAGYACGENKPF